MNARCALAVAGLLGGCFNPSYNEPACGPNDECPSGYACNADKVCAPPGAGTVDAAVDSDEASTDASVDATARYCDNPDFLMCEDFEAFPVGAQPTSADWVIEKAGLASTITVDDTHAMGQRALRIRAPMGDYTRNVVRKNITLPDNCGYGRFRIWLSAFPNVTGTSILHLSFASASNPIVRMNTNDTITSSSTAPARWVVNGQGGSLNEWVRSEANSAPVTTAAGRFMCLEFQVDGAMQETRVWVDGTARPDLVANNTTVGANFAFPQPINRVEFGFTRYQQSPDVADVWLDDLVISKTRVGCP